ncbi:MAG: hypothetical protein R8M11_07630 [Gallionella sp.]
MKKYLAISLALSCFAQPAFAANNIDLGNFASVQADFKSFSEDLGSALSYKAVIPAEPLGITGFDIALEVSSTEAKSLGTAIGTSDTTMIVPKLHIHKGLPFNIDVGAFYSSVPTTNIKLFGAELRYAILEGGIAMPAVAIRASMSKLSGVDELAFNTSSLDISISKGFAMVTPYVGIGTVKVSSDPGNTPLLVKESFNQGKTFAGVNLNLGLTNIAIEFDKTGSATSYSAKVGLRF